MTKTNEKETVVPHITVIKPKRTVSPEVRLRISNTLKEYARTHERYGMRGMHHSQETKEKLRQTSSGRKFSLEARLKMSENSSKYWLGKNHSDETKEKLRQINTGKKGSLEKSIKLSLAFKGKTQSPEWIEKRTAKLRGQKRSEEFKKRISEIQKGQKVSEETKEKIRQNAKINPNFGMKGRHLSEETKEKLRIARSKQIIILSPEVRKKIGLKLRGQKRNPEVCAKIKEKRKYQICPCKDSKIELKIQGFLKEMNFNYVPHQYINDIPNSYQCDIYLPSRKIVIECDGNYWHNFPHGTEKDHNRTKDMLSAGYKVIRLWESDIKKLSLHDFQMILRKELKHEMEEKA